MNSQELERFLQAKAILLPEPFDGGSADLAFLSPLADRIVGHDIIALGEMNHFVHEKSDFRLLLARFLLSLGWTDYVEELGWSDGHRVNAYLRAGDEGWLGRLPSFGYTAHLRDDRNDRPGGILSQVAYPTEAFLWEQKRFYRGLRAADGRARLAGIDIDGLPGGAYEDIAAMLPSAGATAFFGALERVLGENATSEAGRVRNAAVLLPRDAPIEVTASLAALSESLEYIAMTYSAQTYDEVRPGMAFRENAMKHRLTVARRLFDSSRLVVMAHALHVAKDDSIIKFGGVGPGAGLTSSLGHWLAREQKQKVFSIWLLYGGGEDSQPFAGLPRRASFPRHTLNVQLARSGQSLLFFPGDAPDLFGEPCVIGQMYNSLIETPLAAQADAVVFLPTVTPLRRS